MSSMAETGGNGPQYPEQSGNFKSGSARTSEAPKITSETPQAVNSKPNFLSRINPFSQNRGDHKSDVHSNAIGSEPSSKWDFLNRRVSRREAVVGGASLAAGLALAACGGGGKANADSEPHSKSTATSADEGKVATSTPVTQTEVSVKEEEVDDPAAHLQYWARKAGVEIGTSISYQNKVSLPQLTTLKTKEFSVAAIGDDLSWKNLEDKFGAPQYDKLDQIIDFSAQNNMLPVGHALIYSQAYPDRISNGNFTKEQLSEIVRAHVFDTVSHLKGKVTRLNVLNEFQYLNNSSNDILRKVIGQDLVDIVFKAARDADPDMILLYNDFDNETTSGSNYARTKAVVDRLKAQQYKGRSLIDGVGLQMHIDGSKPPLREDIIKAINSYGLPAYITEMDVNMKDVVGEDRFKKQADIYRTVVQAALDAGVKSIAFWTPGDKYSWIETSTTYNRRSPNANPTMFNDDLTPKDAFYAVLEVLKAFAQR